MATHADPLEFRMLGELEVRRGGAVVELPPSKKTRALLAYLVLTGRQHRRDALCNLLWDVTDDPRGALRWSLSKLRKQVDDGDTKRIRTDRERVGFEAHGAAVDVLDMRSRLAAVELAEAPTEELERWCERCSGEVLEGIDLPDFDTFQAWLVGEREQTRKLRASVLGELVKRHEDDPAGGLPHALAWSRVDPMSGEARLAVMRMALRSGKVDEARGHYQSARRTFAELDPKKERALTAGWHALRQQGDRAAEMEEEAPSPSARSEVAASRLSSPGGQRASTVGEGPELASRLPLTGRDAEWQELTRSLRGVARTRRAKLMLITGEPGIGKSRLLDELVHEAQRDGHAVLAGAAYEGEAGRPYGPWIDALRRLPGDQLDAHARERIAPLLQAASEVEMQSREALFSGVVDVLTSLAATRAPVVVVLEDAHWLDEGSAELLHYLVRMQRESPVLFALSARAAELSDSRSLLRVLRSLRRDVEQSDVPLRPLTADAIAQLVTRVNDALDPSTVQARSGGNPLYALELARSGAELSREGSLADAVRERTDRLSPEASDVLRWCAVLGSAIDPRLLAELSSMDAELQLLALEELERHALLRAEGANYGFAHDVVKQVVYAGLSQPRRLLMHRRAAEALQALQRRKQGGVDEAVVADIARHAALAEDHALAASAYVAAGRRCLKLLAGQNAAALARRGLRHARELAEPARARSMLELYDIQLWAQRPEDPEAFCAEVQALSETALEHGCADHARLGFNMQSYVRWERGDWNAAREKMLMAEEAVRGGEGEERVEALAQAARCEALLERDMGLAESLLREAQARATQLGQSPASLADAEALVRAFLGERDLADRLFQQARASARARRNRYVELQALMSRFELLYDAGQFDKAMQLAAETAELAQKAREGSERPYAQMMVALARFALGEEEAESPLRVALEELRALDAKHRATYAMNRTARLLLARGRADEALAMATEALDFAELLEWPSETVLALVCAGSAHQARGDAAGLAEVRRALEGVETQKASAYAQSVLSHWLQQE